MRGLSETSRYFYARHALRLAFTVKKPLKEITRDGLRTYLAQLSTEWSPSGALIAMSAPRVFDATGPPVGVLVPWC